MIEKIEIDRINGIFLEAVKLENQLLLKYNADLVKDAEELHRSIDELQATIDRQNSDINMMRVGYIRYMKFRSLMPSFFTKSIRSILGKGKTGQ